MDDLYIGLMSGTSLDGIDAALVSFKNNTPALLGTHHKKIPTTLKQQILALCFPGENAIHRMGSADTQLGQLFAHAANELLQKNNVTPQNIRAIGSHGQNIRHQPNHTHPYTLQIGDPNIIATHTGIITVADFRRRDLALGGQAAPLAPAFHQMLFANEKDTAWVLNIGGIANLTFLPAHQGENVLGFDTGPGNTLLDAWCQQHTQQSFDKNGRWAKSGSINQSLLNTLLEDDYFKQPTPKSTGREYFNLAWLESHIKSSNAKPEDIQATLLALTTHTIAQSINTQTAKNIWLCGGGTHNTHLIDSLKMLCKKHTFKSTEEKGIHPDWIEAAAFAWLAKQTLEHKPGNLPSVTGAREASILGGIYWA